MPPPIGLSQPLTPQEIIAKLLRVDGSGSLLDADLLDGLNSDAAATASTIAARTAAGRLKAADGSAADDVVTKGQLDTAVAGLLDYQGGYDASANSPDLDVSPSGIVKGDAYTVTVAGTFFTEAVAVGDFLIAEVDNPAALGDWTIVQDNLDVSSFIRTLLDDTTATAARATLGAIAADSTDTLTNKTLDDYSNDVAADRVREQVRNSSGSTIAAMTPVYASGFNLGQVLTEVSPADAADVAKLPAIGLTAASIANNANGTVIESGLLRDVDTSAYSEGDVLYVASGGGVTNTAPTGANRVQAIAIVLRANASNGVLGVIPSADSAGSIASRANYTAAADPTANDDAANTSGNGVFAIGDRWINTSSDAEYVCLDATATAAVWTETTGGGGSSLPVDDTTSIVQDPVDNTKQMRIDVGAVATGTVRDLTMPDRNVDLSSGGTFPERLHASQHRSGGADAIKLDDLAAPDDNTDLDATASLHGLMPKADKAKLNGIEAGADVTDATNVAAAGATMDTDASLAGNSYFLDEDNFSSNSATKVASQQSIKAYIDGRLGKRFLATYTPSAVASVDITSVITTDFDHYLIVYELLPATDNVYLALEMSDDNGATWKTGASDYQYQEGEFVGATASAAAVAGNSEFVLCGFTGSATDEGVSGSIRVRRPTSTARPTFIESTANYHEISAGEPRSRYVTGKRDALEDNDAIRLLFSSGNIASGVVSIYGVK